MMDGGRPGGGAARVEASRLALQRCERHQSFSMAGASGVGSSGGSSIAAQLLHFDAREQS
jgi:hypothetical protein